MSPGFLGAIGEFPREAIQCGSLSACCLALIFVFCKCCPLLQTNRSLRSGAVLSPRFAPFWFANATVAIPVRFGQVRGGLRLDTAEAARSGGDSGPAIVPGIWKIVCSGMPSTTSISDASTSQVVRRGLGRFSNLDEMGLPIHGLLKMSLYGRDFRRRSQRRHSGPSPSGGQRSDPPGWQSPHRSFILESCGSGDRSSEICPSGRRLCLTLLVATDPGSACGLYRIGGASAG